MGWLTCLAFSPPGARLHGDVASGALEEALSELAGREVRLPHPSLEDLQAAHTALFVTNPRGVPAPPYAAFARDGVLLGPSFHQLLDTYRQAGLRVQEVRELPDHLAVLGEAIALSARSRPEVARTLVRDYLRPWLRAFGDRVQGEDTTGFYAEVVRTLKQVVEEIQDEADTEGLP